MAIRLRDVGWHDEKDRSSIDVTFLDTLRPGWFVRLRMRKVYAAPGAAGSLPDSTADVSGFTSHSIVWCDGVDFGQELGEVVGREGLRPAWVQNFPLKRCIEEAKRIAVDFEAEYLGLGTVGAGLPAGMPASARDKSAWYGQLMAMIKSRDAAGWPRMTTYREIARRKRVDVNAVKQWVNRAKKYATATEED